MESIDYTVDQEFLISQGKEYGQEENRNITN